MEGKHIVQPMVALMIWTMIIWTWMYATRIPAMQAARIDASKLVGSNGESLRKQLPETVNWKADNYNHLHEQPTVFYAVALVLAYVGQGVGMNAFLGWIYVGLRIAHSLVQVTANRVLVRFVLYAISSLVLTALIFNAAMVVFAGGFS
ncbi:MAG: MAPEG family protein [Pseudomonadota bacterium]